MKVIFMGTPAFALPSLDALIKNHDVLAVLTQPDRPAGRGHKLMPSLIKQLAEKNNIPVLQPNTLRLAESREIRAHLKKLGADIFVVAAYGLLLPTGVLNMPQYGCVNVHASVLPRYRGASPIHSALLGGDDETGITIMQMDSGIDTGDIISVGKIKILQDERFTSLHDRLAELGGGLLLSALEDINNGKAIRTPQDDSLSTYAPMIKKSDALINWSLSVREIKNLTRAFDPSPGPYTYYREQAVKIWGVEEASFAFDGDVGAGTILCASAGDGLIVKAGDGCVRVTELQALNGKRLPAGDYLRGRGFDVGGLFKG